MSVCCLVGALGCSRVLPDTFFVDFRVDLGWIFDVFWERFLGCIFGDVAFRSYFFARPWHKICTHSHYPSAATPFEGRRSREASSIKESFIFSTRLQGAQTTDSPRDAVSVSGLGSTHAKDQTGLGGPNSLKLIGSSRLVGDDRI